MLRFVILLLFVFLASLIQTLWLDTAGFAPNLVLVAIITSSFLVSDILEGILVSVAGAFFLKFGPGFEKEILLIFSIGAAASILKNYLPWQNYLNNIILIFLGTLIFYIFSALSTKFFTVFVQEVSWNIFFGLLMFVILDAILKDKKRV